MKQDTVYFMTNKNNTALYIGVTSDLVKKVILHKTKFYKGFTARYNCDKLVYVETFSSITEAILREKHLKKGSRERKNKLVNELNPKWADLSIGWF